MRRIHLLRHAMPAAGRDSGPEQWPLSEAGREACRDLIGALPLQARRFASAELKAQQTLAAVLPGPHLIEPRLGEVVRPGEPWGGDFRDRRRAWVVGVVDHRHHGWETPRDAAARISAVCDEWPDDDLVLSTHGMIITAWLVELGLVRSGEPAGQFWAALRFPDVFTLKQSPEGSFTREDNLQR